MRVTPTSLLLAVIVLVGIVGAIVLALAGDAIPAQLWDVVFIALGAVAGVAVPARLTGEPAAKVGP